MKAILSDSSEYGVASPSKLLLGRGKLHLDVWSGNAPSGKFKLMGNAPSFYINLDEDTLEHVSRRKGGSKIDASVSISRTLGGGFQLDEYGLEQLNLFLSGDRTEVLLSSFDRTTFGTRFTRVFDHAGDWLFNFSTVGPNYREIRNVTDQNLFSDNGEFATEYTEGVDWEGIPEFGAWRIIPGSALDLSLTYPAALSCGFKNVGETRIQLGPFNASESRVTLLFTGVNAQTGTKHEIRVHKAKLTPSGELPFISEEFGTYNFEFTAEESQLAEHSSSKIGEITGFVPL